MANLTRNAESRFALNPTNLDISRSRFDRSSTVKTSFNVGQLVPFYIDEVLPGDTFDVSCAKVVRMQPMVTQPMDDLFLDTYFFFVPNRLIWDHWVNLMGENDATAWTPQVEYSVPQVSAPTGGWNIGSLADYFGIPTGVDGFSVSALPFRAYCKIYNDWFRDQNLIPPLVLNTGDANSAGTNASGLDTCELGGSPMLAAKYHDYFTSCLPSPQKGENVTIHPQSVELPVYPLNQYVSSDVLHPARVSNTLWGLASTGVNPQPINVYRFKPGGADGSQNNVYSTTVEEGSFPAYSGDNLNPVNLFAVGKATAVTINELRMAFQLQKMYEKDARGGTRYIEMIKTHFGVTSPDARLQRSEYLGGNRTRITVHQIVQQSASVSGSTPQGNPVGLAVMHDNTDSFCRSFTEHGFVIGLMVARYPHTYQQGLERFWSRKNRLDYYFPVFANIGEQPVLYKEIYTSSDANMNDMAFGYQEAWADYRYKPNRVTGEMRSGHSKSLDVWHFADYYKQTPTLSMNWIVEDPSNIDRVLAIQSSVANQLFADIVISNKTSRPMPLYSIPGLLDHH